MRLLAVLALLSTTLLTTPAQASAPTGISLSPATVLVGRPAGTVVGQLTATDRDKRDRHRFALVSGKGAADNADFKVVGSTLVTRTAFDEPETLSVRVRVTDRAGHRFATPISVEVVELGDPPPAPAARNDTVAATDRAPGVVDVLANDDPGAVIASVVPPSNGTATIGADGRSVTYHFTGNCVLGQVLQDAFTYTLQGGSSATVDVTVDCVNHRPVVGISAFDGDSSGLLVLPTARLLQSSYDPDGDPLHVAQFPAGPIFPSKVTVTDTEITIQLTSWCPAVPESVDYVVADSYGAKTLGQVTIWFECFG